MLTAVKEMLGFRKRETVQPPPPEVLRAEPLPMVGLLALLPEEQKRRALNYEGTDSFGPDELKGRSCA